MVLGLGLGEKPRLGRLANGDLVVDDFQKAALKRLEKGLGAAGYTVDNGESLGTLVNFWVYSCSAHGGNVKQRVSFQLALDSYRAVVDGKEDLCRALDEEEDDLLCELLLKYENDRKSVTELEAQITSMLLIRFAVSSELIDKYDMNSGTHLIIVNVANDNVMKLSGFAILEHPGILTNQEITESVEYFLERVDLS